MILPLIETIFVIALAVLAYIGRDQTKPKIIHIMTLVCGLGIILCVAWKEVDNRQKEARIKENILKKVGAKVDHILWYSSKQFSTMAIASKNLKLQNIERPTEKQISKVLSNLKPTDSSTLWYQNKYQLNWLEFLSFHNYETIALVEEIEHVDNLVTYLDPEIISLLADLKECYYFKEIQSFVNGALPTDKENLSFILYGEYQSKINNLRDYYEKHLKEYPAKTPPHIFVPIIPLEE
jgi:hypothetical protein